MTNPRRHLSLLRPVAFVLILAFLSGCGGSRNASNAKNAKRAQAKLEKAYAHWKGTPYRFGGNTANGIDCSGLIYQIMRHEFGLNLPRTTDQQIRVGRRVKAGRELPGDLIFFKTGKKQLHSGIIISKGRFIHSSTSRGVIISEVSNSYWRKRFLRINRVL